MKKIFFFLIFLLIIIYFLLKNTDHKDTNSVLKKIRATPTEASLSIPIAINSPIAKNLNQDREKKLERTLNFSTNTDDKLKIKIIQDLGDKEKILVTVTKAQGKVKSFQAIIKKETNEVLETFGNTKDDSYKDKDDSGYEAHPLESGN